MNAAIPERRPVIEEISGLIERVTLHNDESGSCVLRVKAKRAGEAGRLRSIAKSCYSLLRLPGVSRLVLAFLRSAVVAALLLISLQLMFGDDTKAPAISPALASADQLYRAGKFAEAEASYRALLNTDSKLVPAQVGLVRAMLRQQKIDEALDAVDYRDGLVDFEYDPKRVPFAR